MARLLGELGEGENERSQRGKIHRRGIDVVVRVTKRFGNCSHIEPVHRARVLEGLVRNLFHSVAVPTRHANDDRGATAFAQILEFALAGKARRTADSRRFFHAIFFRFRRLIHLRRTLLEINVAGGTGTHTAARVLDVDAVVEGDFQQRLMLATQQVPLFLRRPRQRLRVVKQKGDRDHIGSVLVVVVAFEMHKSFVIARVRSQRCTLEVAISTSMSAESHDTLQRVTSSPLTRPHALGLTRVEFVEAARVRGRSTHAAREEYRALFRKGLVPSWCEVAEYPVTATLVEGEASKFLLRLDEDGFDGLETESVIIPMPRDSGTTTTLCVSSQIGCAMGCTFCETAQMGLLKNLRADQIVHQWFAATHRLNRTNASPVKNIVFMGMGEPTDNIDEVIQAIRVLVDHDGAMVPSSNITISTVGNPAGIERIAELVREEGFHRLNLALSLNAPNDSVRSSIMPVNKSWPMQQLRDALVNFPRFSKSAICVEYVLIPGVNDGDEHCDEVCAFLRGIRCSLNIIPYNPRRDSPWPAPEEADIDRFMRRAVTNGQFTKRRGTKGRDRMAACGQLGNEQIRQRRRVHEDGTSKPIAVRIPARAKPRAAENEPRA